MREPVSNGTQQRLRLGLDLGTNSIGWCLFRLDDNEPPEPVELVDGGVLIHSDGRNPKNRTSNASNRREKRGMRRNRDRMLSRQQRLAQTLHQVGLLPADEAGRNVSKTYDPWELRAAGLDRKIEAHELGCALMSFVDRRGFKSNRKTDGGEEGKIRKAVSEQRARIEQSQARTLGEYLWRRKASGKPIRADLEGGLYPDRAMIEDELKALRDAQEPHHPHVKPQDWEQILKTILFQRDLLPVERGRCTFLPDEERIDKAHPLFQRFRIWQEVVNLQVTPPSQTKRPLNSDERKRLVEKLLETKERTFDQIVAFLGLPEGTRVNFANNREKLDGDQTAAVLRGTKRFGKAGWAKLTPDNQQELVERLLDASDHQELVTWLQERFELSEEAADQVATARLPNSTGNLSKVAIQQILPHLREGLRYSDAVEAAGLGHHSYRRAEGDKRKLPYYGEVLPDALGGDPAGGNDVQKYGRIANPTVHIALGQIQKLFNAIVDEHGQPHQVIVELGRDLKQNEQQRLDDMARQKANRERNEHLRELASKAGHPNPSGGDMEKLRLWHEQGRPNERVCPFTGEALSIEKVLSSETEVEHLLPYSRSLDNSMNNKVVVMTAANREKGNRSPFEAWGHDTERYEQILNRAKALPRGKEWRFQEDAMEEWEKDNKFLDRQLTENRYLSKLVRDYLEVAVDHKRIWVTPGRMTAKLRRDWGLDSILSGTGENHKNRDDHRHHLVDAVVIGMMSRSLLQKVATASGRGESLDKIATAEPPWLEYRADVQKLVERCVVRHRPDHFTALKEKSKLRLAGRDVTSGALHNETAYGIVWDAEGEPKRDEKGNYVLVETKALADLKNLEDARDLALRDRLERLREQITADNPAESDAWVQKELAEQARKRYGVRRVRNFLTLGENSVVFIRDKNGRPYKAYKTDGNAYMDIWMLPNGKTRGEIVSRFKANQADGRSQIQADHPTAKRLMRLHVNDMVAMGEGAERQIYRVQKMSKQTIVLVDHQQAGSAHEMQPTRKQATRVLKEGMRKVSVDVLGRVRDGGPFDSGGRGKNSHT